jgi:type II secretory pathway pseudopilin PulG
MTTIPAIYLQSCLKLPQTQGFNVGSIFFLFALLIINPLSANADQSTIQARQAEARARVSAMNSAQQAYYLQNQAFTNSLQKLGVSQISPSDSYKYGVSSDAKDISDWSSAKAVYHFGVAMKPGFKNYVGGVFLVPKTWQGQTKIATGSILCEASKPDVMPEMPTYRNGAVRCGAGTTEVKLPIAK